jgi:hypothetical protein
VPPSIQTRARACASALAIVLTGAAATVAAQDTTAVAPAPAPAPAAAPAPATPATRRPIDPWANGAQWLSVRAGYVKSLDDRSANGNVGAGFGLTAMGKGRWSVGAFAHLEVLGRYASASELEMPLTLEFARHSSWGQAKPYVGLGGGAFYHKTYRTGGDSADLRPGFYFLGGINMQISERSLLGFDVRGIFQGPVENDDPVFGSGKPDVSRWSVKINYSRVN